MRKKQFPPDDPPLALTAKVYDGVQRLYLDLMNRSASENMRPVHKPNAEHDKDANQ